MDHQNQSTENRQNQGTQENSQQRNNETRPQTGTVPQPVHGGQRQPPFPPEQQAHSYTPPYTHAPGFQGGPVPGQYMQGQMPPGYQPYAVTGENVQSRTTSFIKRLYEDDGAALTKVLKVISYIFFGLVPISFLWGLIQFVLFIGQGMMEENLLGYFISVFSTPLQFFVYGILTIWLIKMLSLVWKKD